MGEIFLRIIDFHCHVYPEAIAQKAAQSVRDFYGLGNDAMDGKVDTLLTLGQQAGITDYVILPVSLKPERTRHINQFILDQVAEHPEFIGFGTVHAAQADLMEEVKFIISNGLRGIKMHPDSQVFPIDDPRLFPVYDAFRGRGPVLVHMGDTRYNYSHPQRLRRILDLFPGLQVIAAHFGGYSMQEIAFDFLKDTDCYFDVSSSLMFMQPGEAESYVNRYGAHRFLYGGDFPMWNPVEEMERFNRLSLTETQREQIFHENAERLLKL